MKFPKPEWRLALEADTAEFIPTKLYWLESKLVLPGLFRRAYRMFRSKDCKAF